MPETKIDFVKLLWGQVRVRAVASVAKMVSKTEEFGGAMVFACLIPFLGDPIYNFFADGRADLILGNSQSTTR